MIGWHFKNIREADTCIGADHAALLMQHIVQNTSVDVVGLLNPHLSGDAVQQVATSHITVNPWPGSFQLTANPSLTSDMGENHAFVQFLLRIVGKQVFLAILTFSL